MDRKQRIARSFGRAVEDYDRAAVLQRHAAEQLARRVEALDLRPGFRALEIGCGTGLLSRRLVDTLGGREWWLTDLSPEMVAACRDRLGPGGGMHYRVMDGERPDLDGPFDLIISGLTVQWFEDLPEALGRLAGLLAPGGHLAFSTLARDTFREWKRAHHRLGLVPGTPDYPGRADLQAMLPSGGAGRVEDEWFVRHYPSGRRFLASLRATGAFVAGPGHRPLSAGALRRVLHEIELQGDPRVTYHIAYGLFTRQEA